MEKIMDAIKKNKAVAVIILLIAIVFGGLFLRRHFKKTSTIKTAKTQQVKTNPDGTLKVGKKSKTANPQPAATSSASNTPQTSNPTTANNAVNPAY